jgi:5-histidylcysteine sulfoxide synthase
LNFPKTNPGNQQHSNNGDKKMALACLSTNTSIDSSPLLNLDFCSRQDILEYFDNTWALTEILFSALKTESCFYKTPYHNLRHPMIFYYAHSAVLYINKCKLAGLINESINPYFEQLFSTGVDEMSWDDMSKNDKPWPTLKKVTEYRQLAYRLIKNTIENHPGFDKLPITKESPLWAIIMAFEHERIHIETSSVLIRELSIEYIQKPKNWPDYYPLKIKKTTQPLKNIDYPTNQLIDVRERTVQIGKPENWPSYGWDNEYGNQKETVPSFKASQFLISNGDFFEFVKENGYNTKRYWSDEGWQWRNFRKINQPAFWVKKQMNQYQLRLCFDEITMQWDWPVNVNFHEAKAYCAWLSEKENQTIPYRLVSEAEHHCLRDHHMRDPIQEYSSQGMKRNKINLNLAYGSESPVNAGSPTISGFYDVFGNLWEWCSSLFSPLPGFKSHYLYHDFSTPCFDGQHNLIMGGSFASTGDEASQWARFHFRRHFFQHAGFRIAQSKN